MVGGGGGGTFSTLQIPSGTRSKNSGGRGVQTIADCSSFKNTDRLCCDLALVLTLEERGFKNNPVTEAQTGICQHYGDCLCLFCFKAFPKAKRRISLHSTQHHQSSTAFYKFTSSASVCVSPPQKFSLQ